MKFQLTFSVDNAAFVEDMEIEIIRILGTCADAIGDGNKSGPLIDHNGNTIGAFELTD